MPPLTRRTRDRQLQVMVTNPAARSLAVASGQQIGTSGTIPGVTSYTVTTAAGSTGVTGSGLGSVVVGGLYTITGVTGAFTVASVDSSTHITTTMAIPTTVSNATMIQAPQQPATLTGTIQQSPSVTSLSAAAAAGDTSISVPYSIPSGSYVVIDQNTSSSTQETGLTTGVSGSGPYTVTLSAPLGYPHAAHSPVQAPTTSPNGDRIAGVGHQVLNNAGSPVVVMGNLNAVSGGGSSKLPSSFQDGGFSFVDAQGNQVAGYSQETGLYGFSAGDLRGASYYHFADDASYTTCVPGQSSFAIAIGDPGYGPPYWCDPTTGKILLPGVFWEMLTLDVPSNATGYGMAVGQTSYHALDLAAIAAFQHGFSGVEAEAADAFWATDIVCLSATDLAGPSWTLGFRIDLDSNATEIAAFCSAMLIAYAE